MGTDVSQFADRPTRPIVVVGAGKPGKSPVTSSIASIEPPGAVLGSYVRYWPTELEVSCLVWALRKIRHLVESAKTVVIYTAHSSTVGIAKQTSFNTTALEKLNLRLVRASQYIQQFRLNIYHKPGKTNIVPDALSRLPQKYNTGPDQHSTLTHFPPFPVVFSPTIAVAFRQRERKVFVKLLLRSKSGSTGCTRGYYLWIILRENLQFSLCFEGFSEERIVFTSIGINNGSSANASNLATEDNLSSPALRFVHGTSRFVVPWSIRLSGRSSRNLLGC